MSFKAKELREKAGELYAELQELKTGLADGAAFTEEQTARWDSLEVEYKDLLCQAESMERVERLEQPKKSIPAPATFANSKKPKTRKDTARAVGAFLARGTKFQKKDYIEAANEADFNWDSKSITIQLHEDPNEVYFDATNALTNPEHGVNEAVVIGFERAMSDVWDWSKYCTIRRTADAAPVKVLTHNDTSNNGAYTDKLAPVANVNAAFAKVVLNAYKVTSGVFPVPNEDLRDIQVNLPEVIGRSLGERIGRFVASEIFEGDGTDAATGFSESTTLGETTFYGNWITADDLIDHYFTVPKHYRNDSSCAWMMHSLTLAHIYKLAAEDSFIDAMLDRSPEGINLMGKPIILNDDLPVDFTGGTQILYFGAWKAVNVRIVQDVEIADSSELYFLEDAKAYVARLTFDSKLVNPGDGPIRHMLINDDGSAATYPPGEE